MKHLYFFNLGFSQFDYMKFWEYCLEQFRYPYYHFPHSSCKISQGSSSCPLFNRYAQHIIITSCKGRPDNARINWAPFCGTYIWAVWLFVKNYWLILWISWTSRCINEDVLKSINTFVTCNVPYEVRSKEGCGKKEEIIVAEHWRLDQCHVTIQFTKHETEECYPYWLPNSVEKTHRSLVDVTINPVKKSILLERGLGWCLHSW